MLNVLPFLRRTAIRFLALLLVLAPAAAFSLRAAEATPTPALRPITPEDLWSVRRAGALDLSPDGSRLVFTVQDYNLGKNNSVTHLWLLDTAPGAIARPLTTADSTDSAPVWSPDGARLAFTSKRGADENPSLYVLRLDGGEPEKILELPLPISSPRWLPDGQRLVFATRTLPSLGTDFDALRQELKKQKDSKVSAKVTENRVYRYFDSWQTDGQASRLMIVDLSTKKITDLTPRWDRRFRLDGEVQFDLSPDGQSLVLCAGTTPPPFTTGENTDLYLLSVAHPETEWKNLTADHLDADSDPVFSPDGRAILFGRRTGKNLLAAFTRLMRHDLASGRTERLSLAGADRLERCDVRCRWPIRRCIEI